MIAWQVGDLAECIADGWVNPRAGSPRAGTVCRIEDVHPFRCKSGDTLLTLRLEGIPGRYLAIGFEKVSPAPLRPATSDFTREMLDVRTRVQAKTEGEP